MNLQATGAVNYHAGLAAEACVERHYTKAGLRLADSRWRGTHGELDLVLHDADDQAGGLVFVEVKKSKTFHRAAESLSLAQIGRICVTAEEYLGTQPRGALTPARFDLAVVDATGAVRTIENAFGTA